jgi:hypothetical protein
MNMESIRFCTYGHSPALRHARKFLEDWGYAFAQNIQDATHLILPVPTKDVDALPPLPNGIRVFGGNIPYGTDLLKDPYYLEENAAITAHCALKYADIQPGMRVLVIGWGRIGKVLAVLLKESGAQVTVGLRKEAAWKEAEAAGVQPVWMQEWKAREFDVVYNTVPASVLFSGECREDATLIDLASTEGIFGNGVIRARGLPGKDAPEESGALIAKTVLRYALSKEEEV